MLWQVGDKVSFAFIVKKGGVKFINCDLEKNDELENGSFVGDVRAMVEDTCSQISVMATRKSIIYKLYREELLNFLNLNPGLAMLFLDLKYFE